MDINGKLDSYFFHQKRNCAIYDNNDKKKSAIMIFPWHPWFSFLKKTDIIEKKYYEIIKAGHMKSYVTIY